MKTDGQFVKLNVRLACGITEIVEFAVCPSGFVILTVQVPDTFRITET